MQFIQFKQSLAANVPVPVAGSINYFVDVADNLQKGKRSDGSVVLLVSTGPTGTQGSQGTTGTSGVPTFDSVLEILTYTGIDDLIFVSDVKRGGSFARYNGSFAVDNGVVFMDGNGQKWKRVITTNYISIAWYGATLSTGQTNDIYSILMLAIAASYNPEISNCSSVYIPGSESQTKWFYCSQRINISKKVKIFGDGSNVSHIKWNANVGGIFVGYGNGSGLDLTGIRLSAYGRVGTSPGLEFKWLVNCVDVWISTFGYGFYCDNTMPTGNSNNSTFTGCSATENNYHGFYFSGPDSNVIKLISCEAVNNGGLGICDNSFLGNNYYGFHAASNGSPEISWQKGLVKIGTAVYASIRDNNVGIEPGVTSGWQNYWTLLVGSGWYGFPNVIEYNPATVYFTVGSWNLDGFNLPPLGTGQSQAGVMVGCYSESDQAPGYIGGSSISVGGLNAHRGIPTTLNGSVGGIYTMTDISAGETSGDNLSPKGFVSKNGVGIRVTDGQSALIAWDKTKKVGYLGSDINNESLGKTLITSASTTAASLGRLGTIESSIIGFQRNILMTAPSNRGSFIKVDLATSLPATTNLMYGDLFLATSTVLYEFKPEVVVVKCLEPSAGVEKKNYAIKGYQEDILSNVTGSYTIGVDYTINNGRGILYNLQFVGSNSTNDCIINREILVVTRAGVPTIVNNIAIRPDYVPGGFSSAAFGFTFFDLHCQLQITGLPVGTNGKVNIKRIDY